jgi:uncharacterized phiE125 gp8 family phage protein
MDWSSLTLVTAPDAASPFTEVVTVSELKTHCRIDVSDEDTYLEAIILAARQYAENYTWRAFMTQTWRATYDCFPCVIEVPRPPLQSVTSITYVDDAGDTQTLSASLYQVDTKSQPGRIIPAYGESWPTIRSDTLNAVTVNFVAGYGDDPEDVPAGLRHAVKFLAGHFYENRENVLIGNGLTVNVLPMAVESLLGMHSMKGFC